MPGLTFKKATRADCLVYYTWASDPEVRKNSFTTTPLRYDEHVQWFFKKIAAPSCFMFVAGSNGKQVGQVRIEVDGSDGTISFSIARETRKLGFGTAMITALPTLIKEQSIPVKCLVGQVKITNVASRKCFEKNDYTSTATDGIVEYRRAIEG